jgi:hypothetical protein
MSEDEPRARLLPTADATVDKDDAANARGNHGPVTPVVEQALTTASTGEQTGTDHAETPASRSSEAEVTRVVDVLHEQADRLMVDADRMAQRAAETRATAAQQDRQADDLEWRADRLHAQADHLRDEAKR